MSEEYCVNSILISKHLDQQDQQDQAFQYVYDKVIVLFRSELEAAECQEDIYDDIVFETGYIIDRDSWDVDKYEIVKQVFEDFDIKEAK